MSLELLAEGGVVALSAWLVLVGYAVWLSVRVVRSRSAENLNRYLAAAITAGITGALVQALVSLVLRTPTATMLFYLLIALSWVNYWMADLPAAKERPQVRLRGRLPVPAIILLTVASTIYCYAYFRSEVSLQEAMRSNVDRVATACPFCVLMLDSAVHSEGVSEEISIADIAELVADAI